MELDDQLRQLSAKLEKRGIYLTQYGNVVGSTSLERTAADGSPLDPLIEYRRRKAANELFDVECVRHALLDVVRVVQSARAYTELTSRDVQVSIESGRQHGILEMRDDYDTCYIGQGNVIAALLLAKIHCRFVDDDGRPTVGARVRGRIERSFDNRLSAAIRDSLLKM